MKFSIAASVTVSISMLFWACGDDDSGEDESTTTDGDPSDTSDSDSNSDSDSDSDDDTGSDTGTGIDTDTFPEIDELAWVAIEGGTFIQGSDLEYDEEKPIHEVTVSSFEVLRTEVTAWQFMECVAAGECPIPNINAEYCNFGVPGMEDHPMNNLSWSEAEVFCEWAGGRLPTESEWEYAAKGAGAEIDYPWGNEEATCNYCIMAEDGDGCGSFHTWPVCSKLEGMTAHGLCDMGGNVYEFVKDNWHNNYQGAPTDGSAWTEDTNNENYEFRVIKGGGFCDPSNKMRAAYRRSLNHYLRTDVVGFRCVR